MQASHIKARSEVWKLPARAIPCCQCTDKECPVAFAEGVVVSSPVAGYLFQYAAEFGHGGQPNKQGDLCAAKRTDEGEGQIQCGIGGNVGDFIQVAAKRRPLPEFTSQHTVCRI